MRVAYELRQGFLASPEGHCKDGADDTVFSSDAVHPGSMNGLKDEGNAGSFGSAGDIVKHINTIELSPLEKGNKDDIKPECHHLKNTYRRILKITINVDKVLHLLRLCVKMVLRISIDFGK